MNETSQSAVVKDTSGACENEAITIHICVCELLPIWPETRSFTAFALLRHVRNMKISWNLRKMDKQTNKKIHSARHVDCTLSIAYSIMSIIIHDTTHMNIGKHNISDGFTARKKWIRTLIVNKNLN